MHDSAPIRQKTNTHTHTWLDLQERSAPTFASLFALRGIVWALLIWIRGHKQRKVKPCCILYCFTRGFNTQIYQKRRLVMCNTDGCVRVRVCVVSSHWRLANAEEEMFKNAAFRQNSENSGSFADMTSVSINAKWKMQYIARRPPARTRTLF